MPSLHEVVDLISEIQGNELYHDLYWLCQFSAETVSPSEQIS